MSLELLGAIEVRPPGTKEPIVTGTGTLYVEEDVIEDAIREMQGQRMAKRLSSLPVVIGSGLGGIMFGPIGAVVGGFIGFVVDADRDDTSQEEEWEALLNTKAARRSPTLMQARRVFLLRKLTGVDQPPLPPSHDAPQKPFTVIPGGKGKDTKEKGTNDDGGNA